MTVDPAAFRPQLRRRRAAGALFAAVALLFSLCTAGSLAILLARVAQEGWPFLSRKFLTNYPSQMFPEEAGIYSAIYGSLWLILASIAFAVPVGIGAAVYLQEYAPKSRLTSIIHLNIANLAGVPSIVYGMLGLAVFVRYLRFDRSVLSGALTLSLLVLPVIIIATREALAAVPSSIREAALALGATRWQTIRAHILPAALPGIMTGVILALSRAIGEAAPLIVIGVPIFLKAVPNGLFDRFTALPLQIYQWSELPDDEFRGLAAAGIIVLLGVLLSLNAVAIGIRTWQQRHKTW